jgi:putative NADH-flavin reductase
MSAYAILGATGNTGLSILQLLTKDPDKRIHVLVRSKTKLEKLFPGALSNPNIHIFEGSISDIKVLQACLKGSKAAFLTVAVSANIPGCSIAQDTATSVIEALQGLREHDKTLKPPRLVVLSSASMDDKFWINTPAFVHQILGKASSYIYADLGVAESILRKEEDWLSSVFVMPGGIVHDEQKGHELSATKQQTFVSFLDVAAGMIECADEEGERWDGAHVSVVLANGAKARILWSVPVYMIRGMLCHFFPWSYPYIG